MRWGDHIIEEILYFESGTVMLQFTDHTPHLAICTFHISHYASQIQNSGMAMNKNEMKRLQYRRIGISENSHVGNVNMILAMDDVANRRLANFKY